MSFDAARLAPEKAVFRPALPPSFVPGLYGADMTKLSYADQLKHPNWQRKRLEMLEAAGWECENCGCKEETLHVHHRRYVKGRMAWEYESDELRVLCEKCHAEEHEAADDLNALLATLDTTAVLAFLAAYYSTREGADRALVERAANRDLHSFSYGFVAAIAADMHPNRVLEMAEAAIPNTWDDSIARVAWSMSVRDLFKHIAGAF